MNLNGVGQLSGLLRPTVSEPRNRVENDAAARAAAGAATLTRPVRETVAGAEHGKTLPVEAPAGTDPELWSVLSSEERTFFARVGAMGPLTYGHLLNAAPRAEAPVLRGGRLDVRA